MAWRDIAKISSVLLEMVSFEKEAVDSGCVLEVLEDLSHYVILASNLPNALIASLWKAYLETDFSEFESKCAMISEGAFPVRITSSGPHNARLEVFTQDAERTFVTQFELDNGVPKPMSCHRLWD